ncbi:Beta-hexosaminidase 1 [Apostasia shenzhenica]|uniref:Beta-hexosaminidase n=1 Tax=Apostasia shenzhenica TaxID=1088818 RepID=A0A2I0ALG5_9ASPA|nr:Beta-hexosaminidase 1 [Apostasia shenzhenica]
MPFGAFTALHLLLIALLFSGVLLPAGGRKRSGLRRSTVRLDDSSIYLWPLPKQYSHGSQTLTVDPDIALEARGPGGSSAIVSEAFDRYKNLVFKQQAGYAGGDHDIAKLIVVVASENDTLQLGVNESYTLYIRGASDGGRLSIVSEVSIEANTIYGALRGLETLSQLCIYNYDTKTIEVHKAPWFIQDEPRFSYRGLLLDTSRHFLPVNIIKQVIESMSYAKLNVLHWHIIDEESFPLEVPTYPNLWEGSYTKWERYTVEDAYEIVDFAKRRGIHIMAEIDVPGHAESWGVGYPALWPSRNCTETLDVTKNFSFEVISGILTDMRKIFPFELFHLGGDEVHGDCWLSTPHVKEWLNQHNMTTNDAYQYFVLRAQDIAIAHNWTPVNWEETFNSFGEKLNPHTVVHNWLGPGVCPKVVAKGLRCIASNQGVWYLDHLDIPWEDFYTSEPLEGINVTSQQELVLGGEVCMWGETTDTSDVQQTIWPRAAAAAERLWSSIEATSAGGLNDTVLHRLQYFRGLLNHRGVPAAPVTNRYARQPPIGPGSCFSQ